MYRLETANRSGMETVLYTREMVTIEEFCDLCYRWVPDGECLAQRKHAVMVVAELLNCNPEYWTL